MTEQQNTSSSDDAIDRITAAMERAAVRARQVAAQTGTRLVLMRDGVIVYEDPGEVSAEPPAER